MDTPEADERILHYCMEGIRMNGTFGLYREAVKPVVVEDNGRQVEVKPGDRVFVSFVRLAVLRFLLFIYLYHRADGEQVGAAKDPHVFPEPEKVRLDRPLESYIHYGVGPHTCLGRDASRVAITAMVKMVCRLDNLRRAPGPQGQLKKIPRPGGFYIYMREDHGSYFPFPTSKCIPRKSS